MKLLDLHHFWFDKIEISHDYYQLKVPQWFFGNNPKFDQLCLEKFSPWLDYFYYQLRLNPGLIDLLSDQEYLTLIILFDQIPRNSFRKQKKAFDYDFMAQKICLNGLEQKKDKSLSLPEKMFFYLPLEHSENLDHQELSVHLFSEIHLNSPEEIKLWSQLALDKAISHRETIINSGHFPYRVKE